MSAGTLTQLIASGGDQVFLQPIQTSFTPPTITSNDTDFKPTYVCINDKCLINNTAMYGSMPTFSSIEDCKKVCGAKPSTLRPQ